VAGSCQVLPTSNRSAAAITSAIQKKALSLVINTPGVSSASGDTLTSG